MKVAQNFETNPNMLSIYLSHASNYPNLQPFSSISSVRKGQALGKHSRMFSSFTGVL
jgi:hypothetical protein